MATHRVSRRRFLQTVGAAAAAGPFLRIPRLRAAGMVRHASIGAAGMALSDMNAFSRLPNFELIAVADVDLSRTAEVRERFPQARIYQDWRELLAREAANIDSVNVSTPDHMHCLIALEAMKLDKAVYVQKPLCGTLKETRLLTEVARQRGLVTQMGIQTSSTAPPRRGEAMVRSGIIGKIREVHTFSNKSWGDDEPLPTTGDPVPASLDWDGWLGVSTPRPYVKDEYHPGQWRRRVDFGTGTLGDMGCHIYAPPYRALALTSPTFVTSYGPAPTAESWAVKARVKLTYPGTPFTAADSIDVWWYDGGEMPPASVLDPIGDRLPRQGSLYVGTEGVIVIPHGNAEPFVLPDALAARMAPIDLPDRNHWAEFVDAVLARTPKCSADFRFAGPLTESVLLGNAAAYFPEERLAFDATALAFPGRPEANRHLDRTYREGWELPAL
jgi:predicted dehydrogenase